MPELPEVETTLRGIAPYLLHATVTKVIVRDHRLRWPISKEISRLKGVAINEIARRAKYLLIMTNKGTLIAHLGMSGRLRVLSSPAVAAGKHDHYDIVLSNDKVLRYTDPRRFGALLWSVAPYEHALIRDLGVEPLDTVFNAAYLQKQLNKRNCPIKSAIMDSKLVVGVGNIYATEALFLARIHPALPAKKLSLIQCQRLVKSIKSILRKAIKQGGTTLRDFYNSEGKPGYFSQKLAVYGREGEPCLVCGLGLKQMRIAQCFLFFF